MVKGKFFDVYITTRKVSQVFKLILHFDQKKIKKKKKGKELKTKYLVKKGGDLYNSIMPRIYSLFPKITEEKVNVSNLLQSGLQKGKTAEQQTKNF